MRELYEEKTGYVRETTGAMIKQRTLRKQKALRIVRSRRLEKKGRKAPGRRKGFGRRDRFFWTAEDRKTESTCFP